MSDTGGPSVEDLKTIVNGLLTVLRARLGDRSTAILMIGVPIPDSEHDRFAAHFFGPCLSVRGLREWGLREVLRLIDAQDTSQNGKPHP